MRYVENMRTVRVEIPGGVAGLNIVGCLGVLVGRHEGVMRTSAIQPLALSQTYNERR